MSMENKKKLIGLNEFNQRVLRENSYSNEPKPNGIACPKCGEELMDSSPMTTLTSYPAQKYIHCPKCDYVGFRIA